LLHRHSFRDGMVIRWIAPSGKDLPDEAWRDPKARCVGLLLSRGEEAAYPDDRMLNVLLLVFNAHYEPVSFKLPKSNGDRWQLLLDTTRDEAPRSTHRRGASVEVKSRSLLVFGLAET